MNIPIFIILFSGIALNLYAQDEATTEGRSAIDHRTRFYEGTPIRKFSGKIDSIVLEKGKFSITSPAIIDGIAYVGTDANSAIALTSAGIRVKYEIENGGAVEGTPAVTKDKVYVGFKNNLFAAFNREDGKLIWKYEPKGPVTTTPLVHDDLVFFTTSNGLCYALRAESGSFKWKFSVLSTASAPLYERGPTLEDDLVIVGTERQQVYTLKAKNGDQGWIYTGAGGQPLLTDLRVFATAKEGTIYALDKLTGRQDWHFRGDLVSGTTDLALADNTLIFGNGQRIMALDSRQGEGFKWQKDLTKSLAAPPIVVSNVIYAIGSDRNLYAIDLASGNELSRLPIKSSEAPSLSWLGDKLLFASGNTMYFIGSE